MLELKDMPAIRELVEVACPACGAGQSTRVFEKNGLPIVKCRGCSSLFVNPRPSEDTLVEVYRRYPQLANGREGQMTDDPEDGLWEAKYRLRRLLEFRASGRLLDLGCGRGDFLAEAARSFDVIGVDVVPRIRPSYATISAFEGRLEDARFNDASFDVVVAIEVLEHLFDPQRTLGEIHRILKPDGLLMVQTGDADSLRSRLSLERWTYVQPPVHLNYFTRRGLRGFLSNGGFRIRASWSFGRAPRKVPGLARLPDAERLRPLLDLAARGGFLGQMYAATKREVP